MTAVPSFLDGFHVKSSAFEEEPSQTIYEEFQRQLLKPENVIRRKQRAITDPSGETISYCQLDELVENFSSQLTQLLGQETSKPVAVFLPPGINRLASFLALNSLSIPLVPLDIVQTSDQRLYIIEHSKAVAVLTDAELETLLTETKSIPSQIILVENLNRNSTNRLKSASNGSKRERESGVCLTLYTSGSTGVPKGVILSDANLLNRLRWQWAELPFARDESDVCIAKTNHLFIDSYTELLGTVLRLQRIVITDPTAWKKSGDVANQMADLISRCKVTRLILVPSLLRALLELPNSAKRLASLRLVVSSGESLPAELAKLFFRTLTDSQPQLANFYGSTEVTGDVTAAVFASEADVAARSLDGVLSIGRPVHNTTIFILDQNTKLPVEQGEAGEIFVSGDNVCMGFAGAEGKDRFHNKPEGLEKHGSSDRLVAMGDLGRIVPGGEIFFCGRSDSIVKIRGNRLSTVTVENALKKVLKVAFDTNPPATKQTSKCKVLCIENLQQSTFRLAAFYEKWPEAAAELRSEVVRKRLSNMLPYYAVPEMIFPIEMGDFPLQPATGKTDQRALKEIAETSHSQVVKMAEESLQSLKAADGSLKTAERIVKTVVSIVLGISEDLVVMDATFFNQGGNSLSVINAVSSLKKAGYLNAKAEMLLTSKNTLLDVSRQLNETFDTKETRTSTIEDTKPEWLEFKNICDLTDEERNYTLARLDYSYTVVEPLGRLLEFRPGQIIKVINAAWHFYIDSGQMSYVAIDSRRKGVESIVGACLNADYNDQDNPEDWAGVEMIAGILMASEMPLHGEFLKQFNVEEIPRGLILSNRMIYTEADDSEAETAHVFIAIEYELIKRARKAGFKAVITANTSPSTQRIEPLLGYKPRIAIYANTFKMPDGSMPYRHAPPDYAVRGTVLDL